jgi:hypothetical protein
VTNRTFSRRPCGVHLLVGNRHTPGRQLIALNLLQHLLLDVILLGE